MKCDVLLAISGCSRAMGERQMVMCLARLAAY